MKTHKSYRHKKISIWKLLFLYPYPGNTSPSLTEVWWEFEHSGQGSSPPDRGRPTCFASGRTCQNPTSGPCVSMVTSSDITNTHSSPALTCGAATSSLDLKKQSREVRSLQVKSHSSCLLLWQKPLWRLGGSLKGERGSHIASNRSLLLPNVSIHNVALKD